MSDSFVSEDAWTELQDSSLLNEGAILPVQWDEKYGARFVWGAEKRLMLAVLEDAILCFQGNTQITGKTEEGREVVRAQLQWEAKRWIFDEAKSLGLSFDFVCEQLGIDPEFLRGRYRAGGPPFRGRNRQIGARRHVTAARAADVCSVG